MSMKKFLFTLFLFVLPPLTLILPAVVVMGVSGEFYSIEGVVREQMRGDRVVMYLPSYSYFAQAIKLQAVIERKPQVVALGTSRAGFFRSAFFTDKSVFYNASGAVAALSDFKNFVDSLPSKPKILIVDMDQGFFDPANEKNRQVERPNPFTASVSRQDVIIESLFNHGGWWQVYADYAAHKFTLNQLGDDTSSVEHIGLHALSQTTGLINDGSDYDGAFFADRAAQQTMLRTIESVASTTSQTTSGYEYGADISPTALAVLRDFLATCKADHTVVIGFIPPMPHAIYEKMSQYPDAYYAHALKELGPTLQRVYAEYGFDLIDSTDPASFGSSDKEMVDVKHASEKSYLRLFIRMAQSHPELGTLADVPYLQARLDGAKSNFEVFSLQELH